MAADRQECRLKNKSQPNRQKIKTSRSKNSRAQRDNCPSNCGEKTHRRDNEKLSIHQNGTLKSRSLLGNQAFACARARKSLKTVLRYEFQTSYASTRWRLCRSLGN